MEPHQRLIPKVIQLRPLSDRRQELTPLALLAPFLQLKTHISHRLITSTTLPTHIVIDAEVLSRAEGDEADGSVERGWRWRGGRRQRRIGDRGDRVGAREGGLAEFGDKLRELGVGAGGEVDLRSSDVSSAGRC